MTPNKLAVYFVADVVLADMVVADIDFLCGRFLLWPIWSCCARYGCTPFNEWCGTRRSKVHLVPYGSVLPPRKFSSTIPILLPICLERFATIGCLQP